MEIKRILLLATFASTLFGQVPQSVMYPAGSVTGCSTPTGFTIEALCTPPEELPLGSSVPSASSPWYDANFGGHLRMLTGTRAIHTYSTISAFSATNKHVAVKLPNGTAIIERETSQQLYTARPGNVSGEGIYWDASDDNVYYYLSGAKVIKHELSTGRTTTLIDYAVSYPRMKTISGGGTSDVTADNWLAFFAPTEKQICALDINNVKTYCTTYTAAVPGNNVGWDLVDYPLMSKGVDSGTGKRYVLLLAKPAMGVYSVDFAAGALRFEYRGPEMGPDTSAGRARPGNNNGVCDPGETCISTPHADTLADESGRQYLVRPEELASPCSLVLAKNELGKGLDMNRSSAQGGGRTNLLRLSVCGGGLEWPAVHIGCAKAASSCVLSTYSATLRDPANLTSPVSRGAFGSEVLLIAGDGSQMRRLAQTRTLRFKTDDYWAMPRATVSPDANYVLFDSNFGVPQETRPVLVDVLAGPQMMDFMSVLASTTTFTLMNADTNLPVPGFDPIPPDAVINRAALKLNTYNIRLNADPTVVEAVEFFLNGKLHRKESVAPFAMSGDTNGDYYPWPATPSEYNLGATIVVDGKPAHTANVQFTLQ